MDDPQFWIGIFGNLGVVGVLIWYVWYNVTVTQPTVQGKLFDRVEAMQSKHDETVKEVCKNFTETIKEERLARRQDLIEIRQLYQRSFDDRDQKRAE